MKYSFKMLYMFTGTPFSKLCFAGSCTQCVLIMTGSVHTSNSPYYTLRETTKMSSSNPQMTAYTFFSISKFKIISTAHKSTQNRYITYNKANVLHA